MSDIFISYARSTEAYAKRIGDALRTLGYAVWRDDELPVHRAYADEIEAQLQSAKAVVVIWSADAARSQWVRSEADRARVDRKLVQLTVDGSALPMPFDQIQCADLVGWTGNPQASGWQTVVASVAALTGSLRDSGDYIAPSEPSQPTEIILAVLPFDNLSTDPEMQFFSDGVSEEIIQRLSRGARAFSFAANTRLRRCAPSIAPTSSMVPFAALRGACESVRTWSRHRHEQRCGQIGTTVA